MMMTDHNDDMLDDIFVQARSVAPTPSDDLMARVMAGAIPPAINAQPEPARGFGARLLDLLGGWPTVGGLVATTCAGVWIGVAPPASVENYSAAIWGDEVSVNIMNETGYFVTGELIDG